jgi:carotenoid cleavage dioxygenase
MNPNLNRRDLIRAFAAFGSAAALPSFGAQSAAQAFDAATATSPWLRPFKGISETHQDLRCDALAITGRWPAELRGRFYRNGPALFERGDQRYEHWFDGDGMVQQFSFDGRAVRHLGRLVRTPKLVAEQKAGRFLYSAFGTRIQSEAPAQGPDSYNTANTNAIEHAGRVLAMWEGGSAVALDPKDLSTRGFVTWKEGFQQVPFSAHPKLDAKGHLWNIGTSGKNLIVWHIAPNGELAQAQIGESPYPGGMVHDMAITAQHIVVPLPPVKLNLSRIAAGDSPEQAFGFDANEPLRILVMRKDDITQRRIFELPAQMVFHVGNAHERPDGNIALTYIGARDNQFLVRGALAVMRGERSPGGLGSSTQWVLLDMKSGRVDAESLNDSVEFPRIDPRRIGAEARYLLTASSWLSRGARQGALFHGIQLRDLQTGKTERYDYGEDTVVEEHIMVPKPRASHELDAWLLGTTFDIKRQVTRVNVIDARHVVAGPIAQATLPYWLPLGFHGNFTPA